MSQCKARDRADRSELATGGHATGRATRLTNLPSAFTHRYQRFAPQAKLRSILVSDFFQTCPQTPA
jgi:hypothetical protein